MMKGTVLTALLFLSTTVMADSVIITETKTWKSVPITVDDQNHTYTYEGTLPEGQYYYTYPGYRCITEKKEIEGTNALMLHAGAAGGADIYCYPE